MPLPPDAISIDSMTQGGMPADAIALDNTPDQDIRSKRFIPQFTKALYDSVPFGKRVVSMLPNADKIKSTMESTPKPENIQANAGKLVGVGASYAPGFEMGAGMFAKPALEGATKLAAMTGEKALAKNLGKQAFNRTLAGSSIGVGAQTAGEASAEGSSPAEAIGQGVIGAGVTFGGGKAFQALGNTTKGMRDVSGRIHNWIVKSPLKAYNYGKNPAEVMQKEGITANTITDYAEKAGDRLSQRSRELEDAVAGSDKTIDATDIIDSHLNAAESKMTGSLKDRSSQLAELETVKTNLSKQYGNLSKLPVQQAIKLKRQLADDFPFTNETRNDFATKAAHKIYHDLNDAVELQHPEIADLNQRVSGLIDITKAAQNRMAVEARNNPIGLISTILGVGVAGGAAGGATGHNPIESGIGTILAAKALTSPAVMTRVANALSKMADVDKVNLFKAAPWFKGVAKKAEELNSSKVHIPEVLGPEKIGYQGAPLGLPNLSAEKGGFRNTVTGKPMGFEGSGETIYGDIPDNMKFKPANTGLNPPEKWEGTTLPSPLQVPREKLTPAQMKKQMKMRAKGQILRSEDGSVQPEQIIEKPTRQNGLNNPISSPFNPLNQQGAPEVNKSKMIAPLAIGGAMLLGGQAQAAEPVKAGQELQGKASTYGWGEKLNPFTFSGERFKPEGITVAMRGVPMGTKVEVTDPRTNKTIKATVNDGGPAKRLNRVVDLSRGAWKELGYGKPGLVNVKVKILELGKGKSYNSKR